MSNQNPVVQDARPRTRRHISSDAASAVVGQSVQPEEEIGEARTASGDDGRSCAITYVHCPCCRLAIRGRGHYLTVTNCPRCPARAAITSPLFASPLNAIELHATSRPTVSDVARTSDCDGCCQ